MRGLAEAAEVMKAKAQADLDAVTERQRELTSVLEWFAKIHPEGAPETRVAKPAAPAPEPEKFRPPPIRLDGGAPKEKAPAKPRRKSPIAVSAALEKEILRLSKSGLSQIEIAQTLNLGQSTVSRYVRGVKK